ncbi:uncharacterized protein RJT21DRAFT_115960 [Scheffersomyces amazonensis]|uniref:uncharacterized protein n=1 Tax=Scheffersomyces amazonensis TaxID=1078765 RepID=UPI00315CCF84
MNRKTLDDFISFDNAVTILTRNFRRGEDIDIFQIGEEGRLMYEQNKEELSVYLKQATNEELDEKLNEFSMNELQNIYTKEDCISLIFELHNFHQLHSIPFDNTKELWKLQKRVVKDLNYYVKRNKLYFSEYFDCYAHLSFFLRMKVPVIEINKNPSSDNRHHKFKALVGNFFPKSSLINYIMPGDSSFRIEMSVLEDFQYAPEYPKNNKEYSESDISDYFMTNIIKPVCRLLPENVSYHREQSQKLYTRSVPDISINSDDQVIPIELKKFSFSKYLDNDQERRIRFNESFSQVLRHCLSTKNLVGILSNYKEIVAIDFTNSSPSEDYFHLKKCKILRQLSCEMIKLANPLQVLMFIRTCISNPNQEEEAAALLDRLKLQSSKRKMVINHLYYHLCHFIQSLVEIVNKEKDLIPSQIDPHSTEQPSKEYAKLAKQIYDEVYSINKLDIKNMLKIAQQIRRLDRIFNNTLSIEGVQEKIPLAWNQIISGAKFGTRNSIVVKTKIGGTDSVIKIFDPIRTTSFTLTNGNARDSLAICLTNMIKEVASLHILRKHPFIPKITGIGFIDNINEEFVSELSIENPVVCGFYYTYDFIEGQMLSELTLQQKQFLEPTIRSMIDQINSEGIAHLDLNDSNIIVEDYDARKVHIIDFGHSYMDWERTYYWPADRPGGKREKPKSPTVFSEMLSIDEEAQNRIFSRTNAKPLNECQRRNKLARLSL